MKKMPCIKKSNLPDLPAFFFCWIRHGYSNKIKKNYKGKILIFDAKIDRKVAKNAVFRTFFV